MKVGLYVCRVREEWKMVLSLDVRVDVAWWLEGVSGQRVSRWLMLGRELPLSQATWMVENFEVERGMDQWGEEHWQVYIQRKLEKYERASGELEARGGDGGQSGDYCGKRRGGGRDARVVSRRGVGSSGAGRGPAG
ncbi:hypothetical protein [Paenibacillus marchantiae]|uniref:hypothetical protein n=1 Tax=Paenibacillus marchantiae TaxID=3026433 RepID=UPI003084496A